MTKKRLLLSGLGPLATLPMYFIFIYIAISHDVPELLVFWSVWLGMVLTFSFASLYKAMKMK